VTPKWDGLTLLYWRQFAFQSASSLSNQDEYIIIPMKNKTILLGTTTITLIGAVILSYGVYHYFILSARWNKDVEAFVQNPSEHQDQVKKELVRCNHAPFLFPTRGYIGYLWDISFRPMHRHQGVDIFAGTEPGVTPIYAAADGYVTRQDDWKSSLIIRIPSDPLHPGRQIWIYYTHMANSAGTTTILPIFPPGTQEAFVQAGTVLGYQGNFSGDPENPVWVHLHISIVKDDGTGHYRNELKISNTYDPSPYFGLELNANHFQSVPTQCINS
jgi:peptidoglycan LD-endopeptidase LytH